MNYFENKTEAMQAARAHTDLMEDKYADDIKYSIEHSKILSYDTQRIQPIPIFPVTDLPNVCVKRISTVDTVIKEEMYREDMFGLCPDLCLEEPLKEIAMKFGHRIAVLNFASFKNPGGRFYDGSMAQEESICHRSTLYNVLSRFKDDFYTPNLQMLNRSLYVNRGIFSPYILFEYDANHNGKTRTFKCAADVYTIAAPNAGAARRIGVPEQEITTELRSRIRFVIQSMLDNGPYFSVILGAFGCGVFRNDPELVAKMFYKELDNIECRDRFYRVIFAIIGDNNADPFERQLIERRESFGTSANA